MNLSSSDVISKSSYCHTEMSNSCSIEPLTHTQLSFISFKRSNINRCLKNTSNMQIVRFNHLFNSISYYKTFFTCNNCVKQSYLFGVNTLFTLNCDFAEFCMNIDHFVFAGVERSSQPLVIIYNVTPIFHTYYCKIQ